MHRKKYIQVVKEDEKVYRVRRGGRVVRRRSGNVLAKGSGVGPVVYLYILTH